MPYSRKNKLTWGGLVDHAKAAGAQRRDLAERKQGFAEQQHSDTHGLAREKFGFDQQQHSDTHGLARDRLNQTGQQWQSTFDYGKERDQIGDQRYREEAADARSRLSIEDQRYDDAWALEKAKASQPTTENIYDSYGRRSTAVQPGLQSKRDPQTGKLSFKPGEGSRVQELMEELDALRRQLGISR